MPAPTRGPTPLPTALPSGRPSPAPTPVPEPVPSAAPTFPPTFHPTAVCGEDVLDAWALATSFEDGWGEWSGGETYDSSDGWSCDGFDRCWSRARESNADGDATGATAPSDGSWWAFVESSNDGWQSADPDDSHPSKRFILRSPPFPASLGDGSGLLWPPSCELALAFDYAMYGADVGELSLVATGCFDDDAADCSDCFDATACALTCGACGDADAETTLWSASGDQGDAWFSTLVEVPTGTATLEFVAVTGAGALSDFALDFVRLAPSPSPAPTATAYPTAGPSPTPTPAPSAAPTAPPSAAPTPLPEPAPSPAPSFNPSPVPSLRPSPAPSASPSSAPSAAPKPAPSPSPTFAPTPAPTMVLEPTPAPSATPSRMPTSSPGSGGGSGGGPGAGFAVGIALGVIGFLACCGAEKR